MPKRSYTYDGARWKPLSVTSNRTVRCGEIVITSNTTVTKGGSAATDLPRICNFIEVMLIGGGGAGGGSDNSQLTGGTGGGAGGVYLGVLDISSVSSLSVVIGAGTSFGPVGGVAPNGNNSTITYGSNTITAYGGKGGGFSSNTGTYISSNAGSTASSILIRRAGGGGGAGYRGGVQAHELEHPNTGGDSFSTNNNIGYGGAAHSVSSTTQFGARVGGMGIVHYGRSLAGGGHGGAYATAAGEVNLPAQYGTAASAEGTTSGAATGAANTGAGAPGGGREGGRGGGGSSGICIIRYWGLS